jgi:hypothetical protein
MRNKLEHFELKMSDNVAYDLVHSFPEAAHLKDVKTKRYICTNQNNLRIYGLNDPKKIIGLTVHDLDEFMLPYWGNGFADKISDLDAEVVKRGVVVTDKNRVFLDKFGLVHVQDMTKAPISSNLNKVTAILTMSFDSTEKLSKFFIFNTYKEIYEKKREANFFFMKHLKIDIYFKVILSEKEIICLLYMLENKSYKYISLKMNISQKTVESHISNISNKTQKMDLARILEFLRICNNDRNI